jgi:hypothetical protein
MSGSVWDDYTPYFEYTLTAFGGSNISYVVVTNIGIGYTNIFTYTNINTSNIFILVTNYYGPVNYQYTDMSGTHNAIAYPNIDTDRDGYYYPFWWSFERWFWRVFLEMNTGFSGGMRALYSSIDWHEGATFDAWFDKINADGEHPTDFPRLSLANLVARYGAEVGYSFTSTDSWGHVTYSLTPNGRDSYSWILMQPSNIPQDYVSNEIVYDGTNWVSHYVGSGPWLFRQEAAYLPLVTTPAESSWELHYTSSYTNSSGVPIGMSMTATIAGSYKTTCTSGYNTTSMDVGVSSEWTPVTTRFLDATLTGSGSGRTGDVVSLVWRGAYAVFTRAIWDVDDYRDVWNPNHIARRVYRETINSHWRIIDECRWTGGSGAWVHDVEENLYVWSGESTISWAEAQGYCETNLTKYTTNGPPCSLAEGSFDGTTYYASAVARSAKPLVAGCDLWGRPITNFTHTIDIYVNAASNPSLTTIWESTGPYKYWHQYLETCPATTDATSYGDPIGSPPSFPAWPSATPDISHSVSSGWALEDYPITVIKWNLTYVSP